MASVMDLALCADAVYDAKKMTVGSWIRSGTTYGMDSWGFFASAYLHKKGTELVVAFRGTDDMSDVVTDASIFMGKYPNQAKQASDALKAILAYHRNIKSIYITGHSLGGGLASILGFISKLPTVTFNAPGMSRSLISDKLPWGIEYLLSLGLAKTARAENILHIRTLFDVVSIGTGPIIGKVHNVICSCPIDSSLPVGNTLVATQNPLGLSVKLSAVVGNYTLCQHKMASVISAIKGNSLYFDPINFSRF